MAVLTNLARESEGYCHVKPVYNPDLKMPHWGKRRLKRNR